MSETPTTDDELTGEPFETPPGEHPSELPDADDATGPSATQRENAETSEDQPSQ